MESVKMNLSNNPLLPFPVFIPDVEARVWEDGRLYLYGSMDIRNQMDYCSCEYHVFSSADGKEWRDHGITFSSEQVPFSDAPLYAPDCVYKDGIYYLYFCTADGMIGVARSSCPYGPFREAVQLKQVTGIDPSVLVDGEEAYLYWGQFDQVRAAKLKENMQEIDEETMVQPLRYERDAFHEASSVRKINGTYYYVYAYEGRKKTPSCLAYATSKSPLGPFFYQGVIIDNAGCDPSNWNNHGSLCQWKGDWYIFYHRASRNSRFNRRVCAEKIFIDEEGRIPEVNMTSSGMADSLSTNSCLPFSLACYMQGNCWLEDDKTEGELAVEQLHCTGDSSITFRPVLFQGEDRLKIWAHTNAYWCKIEITALNNDECIMLFSGKENGNMELALERRLFGIYDITVRIADLNQGDVLNLISLQFCSS